MVTTQRPSAASFAKNSADWVRTRRVAALADCTFPHPPRRTRRATFTATGSLSFFTLPWPSHCVVCSDRCVLLAVPGPDTPGTALRAFLVGYPPPSSPVLPLGSCDARTAFPAGRIVHQLLALV